jgi:hypothetical protein
VLLYTILLAVAAESRSSEENYLSAAYANSWVAVEKGEIQITRTHGGKEYDKLRT